MLKPALMDLFKDHNEHVSYLSRLIDALNEKIEMLRKIPLPEELEGPTPDGILGNLRLDKTGTKRYAGMDAVTLVALGVDRQGKVPHRKTDSIMNSGISSIPTR